MKAASTDYDFVQSIYSGGLARKADANGVEKLSVPERSVMLAWWAKGMIDNGGFSYFYEANADVNSVSQAFLELGFVDAEKACLVSREMYEGVSSRRGDMKVVAIDRDSNFDPFEDCDAVIWALGEEFDSAVATYIRDHSPYFSY